MSLSTLLAACLSFASPAAPALPPELLPGESLLFRFEADPKIAPGPTIGMTGWLPAHTGTNAAMNWSLRAVPGAPAGPTALVLAPGAGQAGDEGSGFNLCVYSPATARDVAASVWLRSLSGTGDRGGGIAWRIAQLEGSTADNYYVARWNPLEDNFRVYVVKDGKRTQLASAEVKADPDSWHAVSISHIGSTIEATFDGGARLKIEDSTLSGPGHVAVWTKGDAGTAFDDASISDATPEPSTMVETMRRDARVLARQAGSEITRAFLAATNELPAITTRKVYFDREARVAMSEGEAAKLPDDRRAKLREIVANETYYYSTRYGSPLAYARAIDLAAKHGLERISGARILDYGYGTIGHLRLLATIGAQCVGVDVDPTLEAVYNQPGDTGKIRRGTVSLVTGSWPGDPAVRAAASDGDGKLDLFLSKNTLKRGYIHPERTVDERMLVKLGVSDAEFVTAVAESLRPGGLLVIYNICPAPAPADQPYKPWADGRCPFPRELLEKSGLVVLAFDEVDDAAAREQGRGLRWHVGEHPMDLEKDLFAWYTIARRK